MSKTNFFAAYALSVSLTFCQALKGSISSTSLHNARPAHGISRQSAHVGHQPETTDFDFFDALTQDTFAVQEGSLRFMRRGDAGNPRSWQAVLAEPEGIERHLKVCFGEVPLFLDTTASLHKWLKHHAHIHLDKACPAQSYVTLGGRLMGGTVAGDITIAVLRGCGYLCCVVCMCALLRHKVRNENREHMENMLDAQNHHRLEQERRDRYQEALNNNMHEFNAAMARNGYGYPTRP